MPGAADAVNTILEFCEDDQQAILDIVRENLLHLKISETAKSNDDDAAIDEPLSR